MSSLPKRPFTDRPLFDQVHRDFRAGVRTFLSKDVVPHYEHWEADKLVDRTAFEAAARIGALGLAVPEAYGGEGETDYRFRYVVTEEIERAAVTSFGHGLGVHDDIALPYLLDLSDEEQKARWLPDLAAGRSIAAIAMTEPGAGSDLRALRTSAEREGDGWVLNGQKTFISNGILADVVVVVARTHPEGGSRGFSLFVVERGTPGFDRGRKLDKVGRRAQDTAEMFFDQVRVPHTNLIGTEGRALSHLMERLPRERMMIATSAIAGAQAAFEWACTYAFEREAFGTKIGDLPTMRFELAEIATELDVTQAYVDQCVVRLNAGELSAVDAAKAKLWTTEAQKRIVDRCLQVFGGYGYMLEYPIARAYIDTRVQTIYGGSSEIMKEIIGRDIASTSDRTAFGVGL